MQESPAFGLNRISRLSRVVWPSVNILAVILAGFICEKLQSNSCHFLVNCLLLLQSKSLIWNARTLGFNKLGAKFCSAVLL